MEKIAGGEDFDKVVLVSGDGDYYKMVRYLVGKNRFKKLLAPNKKSMSSLYRNLLDNSYYAFLDTDAVKKKIAYKKVGKQKTGSP